MPHEVEVKAQRAIDLFFSQGNIAPSPQTEGVPKSKSRTRLKDMNESGTFLKYNFSVTFNQQARKINFTSD